MHQLLVAEESSTSTLLLSEEKAKQALPTVAAGINRDTKEEEGDGKKEAKEKGLIERGEGLAQEGKGEERGLIEGEETVDIAEVLKSVSTLATQVGR